MKRVFGTLLAALVVAGPAAARAAEAELPVPVERYESIRYYSAGVGREERSQLPLLFPVRVIFRTDRGNLLCDADVTISAQGKPVFRGRAQNGPWLLVDLPPGTYDIEAVQDGKPRAAKSVRVAAGKNKTVILTWKTSEVDMGI